MVICSRDIHSHDNPDNPVFRSKGRNNPGALNPDNILQGITIIALITLVALITLCNCPIYIYLYMKVWKVTHLFGQSSPNSPESP